MALQLNQELQNKYPHLEVSVLKYSDAMKDNDSKRIDSEFFKKEYLEKLELLNKCGCICISDIAEVTDGIHTSIDYSEDSGINLISATSPKENVFDLSRNVFISKNAHDKNPRTALKENDVIISTVGTIGNCAVVDKSILPANSDRHVGIIRINKDYSPHFLSTFLLSKYGRMQTFRKATGNVQLNLFIYKLKQIKIPLFPLEFQQQIEQMVRESHACLEQSKGLYREAEVLLYRELGLDPENPLASIEPHSGSLNISVRPLSQSLNTTGRLDSEYYQQKYDEIEKVIKNYRGGYGKISDYFKQNKKSKSFILSEYKYIEIGDINIGTATANYNIIQTNDLPANAKIFLNNGDLLISKVRPNRGAIAIVNFDENDLIGSGAFCVLQEIGEIKKEVLMILLRTPLYKEWLLKFNVGTSYPVIKDEDILNLIIPKIAIETQTQIAEKIKQSFTLRRKANDLLLTAKQTVETAIEKG